MVNKNNIIKEFAALNGLIPRYFDKNGKLQQVTFAGCLKFLEVLGFDVENITKLEKVILQKEKERWEARLEPVQVIKELTPPVIRIKIPSTELDKSFEWVVEEENGYVHYGKFFASSLILNDYYHLDGVTYYQFDLPLPTTLQIGYHTFKLKSEFQEFSMRLIVTPEKCYYPKGKKDKENLWGAKLELHQIKSDKNLKIGDWDGFKKIIKKVASQKGGIVGVGAVNQVFLNDENLDVHIPSNRFFFNSLYINVDEVINFIGDKTIPIKLLSPEFQEKFKLLKESDTMDYKKVQDIKFDILKILYQSFRENHILKNTSLAQDFLNYIAGQGEKFTKLATFRALFDYFNQGYTVSENWHQWPIPYRDPFGDAVINFEKNNIELVQFYQFCQWQADEQFKKAGLFSYEKKLDVGIYTELPFFINAKGAESWFYQDLYNFKVNLKDKNINVEQSDKPKCPIILQKLKENKFNYLIELLRANMTHSGALKIDNLEGYDFSVWEYKEDNEAESEIYEFFIKYPFEEILGIIALESQRNKCVIFGDDTLLLSPRIKQAVLKYGIQTENSYKIEKINNAEELELFFSNNVKLNEPVKKEKDIAKIPSSTYRLQLNKNFTFRQAKELIPYLKNLGISHCYISPILKARSESMHGYDIINHNQFNDEIGSIYDFYEFSDTLHQNEMGLICDIVPNHMGINHENKWWFDVLENGQSSPYADYFDIDWMPLKKELKGKVLVPVLGDHYGNILIKDELKLNYDKDCGKITINYYEHKFPLNPSSYPTVLQHRLEILASRLGRSNEDFQEYQSIITGFKNLPKHTETSLKQVEQRIREKNIKFKRLSALSQRNYLINEFIEENLRDFRCREYDTIACRRLHNLLEEQAYRLAFWRVSVDEINYRRFFDVNDLAGIRVENPAVFADTHSFILDLIEQKKIDGLRLDHPDGLLNPVDYFKKLQIEAAKRLKIDFNLSEDAFLNSEKLPIYLIAEKILAPHEQLPEDWALHGTVGYESLYYLNNLFVDRKNEKKLNRLYHKFIGKTLNYDSIVINCKRLIMKTCLTGELSVLSNYINRISEKNYSTRDFTLNNLRDALVEIIAHFPVYRTYISENKFSSKCKSHIKWAVRSAKNQSLLVDYSIFDFLENILLLKFEKNKNSLLYDEILRFTLKFQQYTAPLMAKGLEDTAFYRYNRLISLNEVGGAPNQFGIEISDFHNKNKELLEKTPHNLLSSSTHDSKRSEDVRARIAVLSEIPDLWQKKVARWSQLNKFKKSKIDDKLFPDKNTEYLFYQTLLGIWEDDSDRVSFAQRIEEYMLKAVREAKIHTGWININTAYEDVLKNFIRRVLNSPEKHPFWKEFLPFQKEIALRGYINSLSQTVLKLTSPGVPDIYQGMETFSFTLVDPDNRKPVNYERLKTMLNPIKPFVDSDFVSTDLLPLSSGMLKLFAIASTLNFRNQNRELFSNGNYVEICVEGKKSENVVAFMRSFKGQELITVVPRFVYDFVSLDKPLPIGEKIWQHDSLLMKEKFKHKKWRNIYTNQICEVKNNKLKMSEIFEILPFAVLEGV